jgi:hypothetical protein
MCRLLIPFAFLAILLSGCAGKINSVLKPDALPSAFYSIPVDRKGHV